MLVCACVPCCIRAAVLVRFPWFRRIGRAVVYLSNLMYPVPLIHRYEYLVQYSTVDTVVQCAPLKSLRLQSFMFS